MEAPVSVSLGMVRSLPAKLEQMLSPEPEAEGLHGLRLREGERKKILVLKDHLEELIEKYLFEPLDVEAPAATARCWAKEVRELSYDIDDFLDELTHELRSTTAANHKNRLGKIAKLREGLRRSRWVADETSRFRVRLEEAILRHKSYNLGNCQRRPIRIDLDEPPILGRPLFGVKAARLVGIDSSMEKLSEWLTGDGEPQLTVVSIVGFGGIGKTTLAKELYCKLGKQFDCRAFVRSSQKPDIRRILSSILLQVRRHCAPNGLEFENLAYTIRAYLQHKKYFIIIDDLWDSSTWDIIHRALPDDKNCSRVLTTTEDGIVAKQCSGHSSKHIFFIQPLSDEDSNELFFSRFVNNQSRAEFHEVSCEIVRKCGGFPLATIAAASILARHKNQTEHYNYISRSLNSGLRKNATMEAMNEVLNLCYNNLPDCLKACMLYLNIYKEGHIIWKDDLIKQWIAEGFICVKRGEHMDEVAGSYFDELVNGGLIQPVDTKYNGEVLSCTVHYMVLNLIRYSSIEENFATAIDHCQTNTRLADKVRRLSLHFGDADDAESPTKLRLSQVRSLVFSGLFKSLHSITKFQLLRVLILDLWGDQDKISLDLTTLCNFFRLINLNITCNVTLDLQIQLQGLEYLETLKIDSRVCEVPQEIVLLPRLLHLSLPGDTYLPNGIDRMASLRTLGCFDLSSNSVEDVQRLGKLSNVRDLHLTCSTIPCDNLDENVGCLALVLSKLTSLRSLNLSPVASAPISNYFIDGLGNISSPPELLEKLELSPRICIFSRLPRWIGDLTKLSSLKIAVRKLWQSDIGILNSLSVLSALSLYVRTTPVEKIVFHKEGFTFLISFKFICSVICIGFNKEAMPNLQRLKLGFSASALQKCNIIDAGFENLRSLEVFTANVGDAGTDESVRKAVLSTVEEAFSKCQSSPLINVQLVNRTFYGDIEMSTTTLTEQGKTLEKPDMITKGVSEEQSRIRETDSREGTSIRGDSSRIPPSLESSSYTRGPGMFSKSIGKDGSRYNSCSNQASISSMPPNAKAECAILQSTNVEAFTLDNLRAATNNFDANRFLGEGEFGPVYKGWIDEKTLSPYKPGTGIHVAVKLLDPEGMQGRREWLADVILLGRLCHPNVVKLIGYCLEDEHLLLVYEFIPHGSLKDHLYRNGSFFQPLSWKLRMKVAYGVAKGLAYLHNEAHVIYRNLKTANILLDTDYSAKLSDCGLAMACPTPFSDTVSTTVMGTHGYAAPEYISSGQLTTKCDVYSFGVVLLEMLLGRPAIDRNRPTKEINIVEWARPYLKSKRKIFRIMDTRLQGQYSIQGVHTIADLALKCLCYVAKKRPTMDAVVPILESLQDSSLELQEPMAATKHTLAAASGTKSSLATSPT